jgi:hypothetical protein
MKDGSSNPQVGREGKSWSTSTEEEIGNCKKVSHFQGHHRDESGKIVLIWTQYVIGGTETGNSTWTSIHTAPTHTNPM